MIARDLRPRGSWGFYGFPRCFNYEKDEDKCSEETMKFNDQYGLFTYLEFNDYTCGREKEREKLERMYHTILYNYSPIFQTKLVVPSQ